MKLASKKTIKLMRLCLVDAAENALARHAITDWIQPQHKWIAQVIDEHVTIVHFLLA